jgi:hypothetical protein
VHKSQLLKSGSFQNKFSLDNRTLTPSEAQHAIQGEGTKENPIKISGVRADDFEKLLNVLYT